MIRFRVLLAVLIFTFAIDSVLSYEFSPYFGVSFSPYIKDFEGNNTKPPAWSTYSLEDLKVMLRVVSKRFGRIATYSAGTHDDNFNTTWEDGHANAFVARAAALINKEANRTLITMAQGIYQPPNREATLFQEKEIEYGIQEIEDANKIYPGTVWALIVYNLYVEDEIQGQETLNVIRRLKDKTHNLNVSIGTRIGTCNQINGGDLQDFIVSFARESDFLMCNIHPNDKDGTRTPAQVVKEVVDEQFWKFAIPLKKVNPNLEVLIGDSGWPTAGVSYSGTHNTLENMRDYWYALNEWAAANKIRVHTFEAFDEPWKTDIRKTDPKDPSGAFGSERHFGWWKLLDNDNITEETILEKVTEIHEEEEPTPIWIWILIAVVLVLLICGAIFAIFYIQYKKVYLDQLAEAEIEEFERGVPEAKDADGNTDVAWSFPYNRDYELPKDKLIIDQSKLLGSGEFGIVYKGKAMHLSNESPMDAAIKTTKPRSPAVTLKSLLSEIKTMIYIGRHENIVEFIGACTGELRQGIVYVIMEFCSGGSLENHLRNVRTNLDQGASQPNMGHYENLKPLEAVPASENQYVNQIPTVFPKLVKWAQEIASGMEFLASKNVIHADLATRNVLLTSNETAKITDFGLSRRLYEYTEYVKKNQEPLPWRWMSPESLHSMTFSSHSDVWSYGITLWEIFSLGDIPYPGLSWTINFVDQLFAGMKPNCPKYAPTDVHQTMELCWEIRPENRPSFSVLKKVFAMKLKPEETSL